MVKRLVVCCDGTWNTPDQGGDDPCPTNVSRLALQVVDGPEQRLHYVEGVGTAPGERLTGGVFGAGLSRHVLDAYRFLVSHYEPGDELFLFGFSRGAFTARSLAGLVRNSGVLRPDSADQVDAAWALYRARGRRQHPGGAAAEIFRKSHSHPSTAIHVLGVWDTVGALGIPGGHRVLDRRWRFHDTTLSASVAAAFHALALDERRGAYVPTLWTAAPDAPEAPPPPTADTCPACAAGREVAQVWFSGVHSDVGGGYPDAELADITFRWMVERATAHGLELAGGVPPSVGTAAPAARDRGECVVPLASGRVHRSVKPWFLWPPPRPRRVRPEGAVGVSVASSVAHRGAHAPDPPALPEVRTGVCHRTSTDPGPLTVALPLDGTRTRTAVVLTEGRTYRVAPTEGWTGLDAEVAGERLTLVPGETLTAPASGTLVCDRPHGRDAGADRVTLTISEVGAAVDAVPAQADGSGRSDSGSPSASTSGMTGPRRSSASTMR